MCLQFGFVILWQKAFGAKDALKMLVKLTPGGSNWQLIYKKSVSAQKKLNFLLKIILYNTITHEHYTTIYN